MKLLHCVNSSNPVGGGVWEAVNQFAQCQASNGYDVTIVTLDDPRSDWCENINSNIIPLGPSGGFGYSSKLLKWLNSNILNYDHVITHGLWQYHGYAVMKSSIDHDIPYFIYPHGMLDPWFKYSNRVKHLKKMIYWFLVECRVLNNACGVIFTCEEEKRLARSTFRPFKCNALVAPLGIKKVDEDLFLQSEGIFDIYRSLRGHSYMLYLGRVHPKKGLDILLKSLLYIDGKLPNLVIAGPVDSELYKKNIDKLIARIRTKHNDWQCIWTGMLSGDMKWGAFHAADAFVLPSHQENFGISVVEALSVGTPVLITNKVNIFREILEYEAGLVADDTIAGVKDMIENWLSLDQNEKSIYAENATKCFYEKFEIQQASKYLENVLRRALN